MTDYYVSSVDGANGTPASVTWWNGTQSTYANLSGIVASIGSGNHRNFVDSAHAAVNLSNPTIQNTSASSIIIISVDRTDGSYLPGAEEYMRANASQLTIQGIGSGGVMTIMGMELYFDCQ